MTPKPTYRALLGIRGVPALYALSSATVLTSSLQILALSIAVYRATGSALWSSCAFAAGFLPQLAGGVLLNSLADRWAARLLLAAGVLLRATAGMLLAFGGLPPAAAIAVAAVTALLLPVPSAAQSALVSRLLDGELYVLGRSVFTLISSGGQLLGLAVGGTLVAAVGTSATFALSGGLQLLGLVAVALLPRTRPVQHADRWRLGDTWRANAVLLRDAPVRRILLSWWIPLALLVGAESLVVPYVGSLGRSGAATGVLLAAFPVGSTIGDLVVGRLLGPAARARALPWLLVGVGASLLPLAMTPGVAVAAGCCAVACGCLSYQLCGQQAFRQALPAAQQGVGFGLAGTGSMAGQGVGPVVAGALADVLHPGPTMAALGAAVVVYAVGSRRPRGGGGPEDDAAARGSARTPRGALPMA
ncbi:MFS transporter [uncultured Jatrophihabitans sp.]|uniref:MFS transporter n=1 Tax=uncultured Jatrophihabitans sp. TaxID=1610747 RepID=UPI0035CB18D8